MMTGLIRASPATLVRRTAVVVGVSAISCAVGAVAGIGATIIVSAMLGGPLVEFRLFALGATTGMCIALVSGPLMAFTLLRHAPIGTSLVRSFVGALSGAAIGLRLAFDSINPYAPLTIFSAPLWQASLGAIVGATAMALLVRWRRPAPRQTHLPE